MLGLARLQELSEAGTSLVVGVECRSQRAIVYEQGKPPRLLPTDGVLEGGHTLPGFKLPLRKIWQAVGVEPKAARGVRRAVSRSKR